MEEDSEAKKIVSSNKPTTICHCWALSKRRCKWCVIGMRWRS
jgi:hypothetical protein